MELSIIIPAYNEEERIEPTLRSVSRFLRGLGLRYEILVVDDGSSDGTETLVNRLELEIPFLRCLSLSKNRGKGHAIRVGMLATMGDIRVMYDADGSMPVSELPKLLAPIFSERADIAIGSRYSDDASTTEAQPWWRVAWSRLANRVVRHSLAPGIRDTQCGFKAFSGAAANDIFARATIDGWAFDLEALALASRLKYRIAERGVVWRDDERSKISPLRDSVNVAREFWRIRRNLRHGRYRLASASV